MHVGPEGEVAEGGGPGVSQAAGEDGRAGGRGEVLDGAVPHARVDRDHAHVALDNTSSTLGHYSYSLELKGSRIFHNLWESPSWISQLTLSCRWVDISTWTPPPQDCLYL